MDDPKTIGKRIKQARLDRGLSQHDLALAAGTTNTTISRLERGENSPRRKMAMKLADALGMTTADLVGDEQAQAEQLDRIEAKIDSIIARLAEDAEVVRLPPPKPRPSSRPNREDR